jgi:hypothetical protein
MRSVMVLLLGERPSCRLRMRVYVCVRARVYVCARACVCIRTQHADRANAKC